MSSEQERCELDARARQGETVVPGGTGGKSLEAQEHLAEGVDLTTLSHSIFLILQDFMLLFICCLLY